jgi:hypothetical protein
LEHFDGRWSLLGGAAMYVLGLRSVTHDIDVYIEGRTIPSLPSVDLITDRVQNRFAEMPGESVAWSWCISDARPVGWHGVQLRVPSLTKLLCMKVKALHDRRIMLAKYPEVEARTLQRKLVTDAQDVSQLISRVDLRTALSAVRDLSGTPAMLVENYVVAAFAEILPGCPKL